MSAANNIEIERKFLVLTPPELPDEGISIRQGYLSTDAVTTRVRTGNKQAWLTIKGPTKGLSRAEFEYEIPHTDASDMLKQFCPQHIEKTRYLIPFQDHTWEVDFFSGQHQGLIIAEIELNSEDEAFAKPDWLGEEVSNDYRYRNSYLAKATWPFE